MRINRLLAAVALCVAAVVTARADGPVARWLETGHDFGAFDEDMGNVTCQFHVVNDGNEPLLILAARATCGCTVPRFTREPIAPGDTATISVTYNPIGRPGKFNKKVKVETNTPQKQNVLSINGVVIGAANTLRARFPVEVGPLKLRTDVVAFGEIAKGRSKTAFLDVYNQSNDTIHPSIKGLPAFIAANREPLSVPPGEQATVTFFYDTSRADDWGLSTHDITVLPDLESAVPGHRVSLVAIVNEDFSSLTPAQRENAPRCAVSDDILDFGSVTRGKKLQRDITVDNYGNDPLLIRKAYSTDPAITAKVSRDKIKKGAQSKITITVDPAKISGDILASRLVIITNDPERPQSTVRIAAQIAD